MADERSVRDTVEGFHLAALLRGLDEIGALDAMVAPAAPEDIAVATGTDPDLLRTCLEFVAGRTDLVARHGDRYAVTGEWDDHARAYVRQYVGAYGRLSVEVAAVLRDPAGGPALVDHGAHARSYAVAPTVSHLVADLLLQLDLVPTLDLGCGSGSLLVEVGRRHAGFVGWGVDASPEMCALARERIAAEGLGERVAVVQGDAFDATAVAAVPTGHVRSVTATSLLNELWGRRPDRPSVAGWLRAMAGAFPGCALVVTDYFGRLGRAPPPWPAQTAVHDLVQALSGQGVPPGDHDAWRDAYREAGAHLLHMVEDDARSFFVHLLKLPGER